MRQHLTQAFARVFRTVSRMVFKWPCFFLLASALVGIVLSLGMLTAIIETDTEVLYALKHSEATDVRNRMLSLFPDFQGAMIVYQPTTGYVTDRENLEEIARIEESVKQLAFHSRPKMYLVDSKLLPWFFGRGEQPQDTYTWEEVCKRHPITGECMYSSVTDLYLSPSQYGQPIQTFGRYPELINRRSRKVTYVPSVLANFKAFPEEAPRALTDAVLGASMWFATEQIDAFDKAVGDMLAARQSSVVCHVWTDGAFTDEMLADTVFDLELLAHYGLCVGIILVYTLFWNSSRDLYRTKTLSGLVAVISALLGYMSGAGFCYIVGLRHCSTANAVPFLIMGIGMDDTFVLMNAYTLTYFVPDSKERASLRCETALEEAGMAITLSTATNIISFGVGAMTPYVAIRNFCVLTIASLIATYVFCFTFFWPVVCLEADRETKKTILVWPLTLCCNPHQGTRSLPRDPSGVTSIVSLVHEKHLCLTPQHKNAHTAPSGTVGEFARRLALRYLARPLSLPLVKAAVVVVFLGLLCTSITGLALRFDIGLDKLELVRASSPLRETHSLVESFGVSSQTGYLLLEPRSAAVSWFDPTNLEFLSHLDELINALPNVVRVVNPLTVFRSGSLESFSEWHDTSTASEALRDLYVMDGTQLVALRVALFLDAEPAEPPSFMKEMRAFTDAATKDSDFIVLPFFDQFVFSESDRIILRQTLVALASAFAGIVLISAAFLEGSGVVRLSLVVVCTALIDVNLLGLMSWWGVKLNMISMVVIVMSVGFSVDYAVHMLKSYTQALGCGPKEKLKETMYLMFPPLLHGVLSTIGGLMVLLLRQDEFIFVVFFKTTLLTLLLGFGHGALLLPCLLSFLDFRGLCACNHHAV